MKIAGSFPGASLWLVAYTLLASSHASHGLSEKDILLEFYQATGGENWATNTGWATEEDGICDWYGVICDPEDLRHLQGDNDAAASTGSSVLGLWLPDNQLVGRTPDSLWQLPALQLVHFSNNPLLQVNFGGLPALAEDLSINVVSPLVSLYLHNTATTSVAGLSVLRESLVDLILSRTPLHSQIPAELYELTKLTSLSLAESNMEGSIPNDIHKLSELQEFNVYGNALTGRLPDGMERLIHLRHCMLTQNQFHGPLPTYVETKWTKLHQFFANRNDFTGSVPSFVNQGGLYELHLDSNHFKGQLPVNFLQGVVDAGSLTSVTVDLRHNELSGEVPQSLDSLAGLDLKLYLGDNFFTAVHEDLCDNEKWNEGAVAQYSCEGLLCPAGSFSSLGFQNAVHKCHICESNEYRGSMTCYERDDRSVLTELYVATGGEQWTRSQGWLQLDNVCEWYGVTCWETNDDKNGRVRKVELPNNNMVGVVPDTIWSCDVLTILDLSQNPELLVSLQEMGNSEHIFSLNIGYTKTNELDGIENARDFFHALWADGLSLGGPFPSDLYKLTSLEIVSLQDCDLSGTLDGSLEGLVHMEGLEELYLAHNNLVGVIPDIWDQLPNLQVLSLAGNAFQGPIPPSLDLSPSLTSVSFQDQTTKGGGLTGNLPALASTSTLRRLHLAKNRIDGPLPSNLLQGVETSSTESAAIVDLRDNFLTGHVPEEFSRFDKLNLYLEGNFVSSMADRLCRQDGWMDGAVGLYGCDAILCPAGSKGGRQYSADNVCSACPASRAEDPEAYMGQSTCDDRDEDLTERDILQILYERCGGTEWPAQENWGSDQSVCSWYGIACDDNGSVVHVSLGNNRLIGSLPTEMYLLPNLQRLEVFSNDALYISFDGMEQAKKLRTLSLDETGLDSIDGIGRARSIEELNLAGNFLSGPIPEELSRLVNLKSLNLARNSLDGYLPYWLRSLGDLAALTLAHNKLEGPLYDFADMDDLEFLDLSNNFLTGQIPGTFLDAIDEASGTIIVNLAHNKLTGSVPPELGRIKSLSISLKENRIESLDDDTCSAGKDWNDGHGGEFGCAGILCPAGTFSPAGRQTSDDAPCESCRSAKYMGSTTCSPAARAWAASIGVSLLAAICGMWVAL